MKKFISMVMAAAMVVSLVPATAFAAPKAEIENTVKVVHAAEVAKPASGEIVVTTPELQMKVKDVDYEQTITSGEKYKLVFNVVLSNAEFYNTDTNKVVEKDDAKAAYATDCTFLEGLFDITGTVPESDVTVVIEDEDEIEVTIESTAKFAEDDVLTMDLSAQLTKKTKGTEAKVTVKSDDFTEASDLVFCTVVDDGITAEVDELTDIAPEEIVALEDLEVETVVGDFADLYGTATTEELKIKVSKGFEFNKKVDPTLKNISASDYSVNFEDDNEVIITIKNDASQMVDVDKLVVEGIEIEATTAKAGDVATFTVKFADSDSVKVDVATVIESGVVLSVDEDEDVPVMWSGVDAANSGLTTDDEEHWGLEVTVEETFAGAYSNKDEIEFTLTDGVYVTDVNVTDEADVAFEVGGVDLKQAMFDAYQEGEHKGFVIEKRVISETVPGTNDPMEFSFELELVADPGFVGDVVLGMLVDGELIGEKVIAKFETPVVVEAAQNDLKIDYRNTKVPTDIVVKEAEAGLWEKDLKFTFDIDDQNTIKFEDDADFIVNEESDMDVKDNASKGGSTLVFEVYEESDDEAAVVTITNIELFMERNIPAGAYDLKMGYEAANGATYANIQLFAPDCLTAHGYCDGTCSDKNNDCIIDDVSDFTTTVKEAFVNVVTAGREQDDASFTTKVVVPVGESYIVAGEETITLDVPAYVTAAGRTMLPVRAVATALGINNNNVLWDQATKTVTILYGQRIITMQVGSSVINVNGSAIPASASVEIVDGRTFLGFRDLATALGVTDIVWDQATKTVTLNGGL